MSFKFLSLTILIMICTLQSFGQWISFDDKKSSPQQPKIELLSSNSNSTVIKIDLPGVLIQELSSSSNKLKKVDLLTGIFTTEPGMPELSYVSTMLAIPDNASLSCKVLNVGKIITVKDIDVAAARKCWIEGEKEPEYDFVGSGMKNEYWPAEYANISEPSVFRDFNVARVSVFPARYNAVKRELRVATSITIEISYGNNTGFGQKNVVNKEISPSFATLYRSTILNYNEALKLYNAKDNEEEIVLFLVPDNFASTFTEYVEWKKQSGYKVILKTFTDIGSNASTNPVTIKNFITTMYNSGERPAYVVLVGDDGVFPKKMITSDNYTFPNENYFVTVDGTDFIPDILIGRIPANNTQELSTILNRAVSYEKTPYTTSASNPDWFKKAIMCSNNEYASQAETKRFVKNILINNGNFIQVDTMMSKSPCTADLNDVLSIINEGRGFINYRGEGWDFGWMANCYYFSTSDVDSYVNNGRMFPFFTSIGCGVAMFNSTSGDCFGERWLKIGTQANPRGAVVFVGPTTNSHTAYNNSIDRGIYKGMFQESMRTPGQALLRGKTEMYNDFGVSDFYTQYQYEIFTVLGDPSTRIWKTTPLAVTADHVNAIDTGSQAVTVTVKYASGNNPVINANVNILGSNICVNAKTNATGVATLNIHPTVIGEVLKVTATGEDVIPYLGSITVTNTSSIESFAQNAGTLSAYPNPISDQAEINYSTNQHSEVFLGIYDSKGQLVKILVNEIQNPGIHKIKWNGMSETGERLAEGTYICKLSNGEKISSIRLILVK